MGAVIPLGIGVENYWTRLKNGGTGVAPIRRFDASELPARIAAEVKDFEPTEYLPKKLVLRNEEPEKASRPFDLNRDGFVMGEGGGALVLETLESALRRGADIKAELLGYANSNDAFHVTSPEPEGRGAILCMKQSGFTKEDVEINAE